MSIKVGHVSISAIVDKYSSEKIKDLDTNPPAEIVREQESIEKHHDDFAKLYSEYLEPQDSYYQYYADEFKKTLPELGDFHKRKYQVLLSHHSLLCRFTGMFISRNHLSRTPKKQIVSCKHYKYNSLGAHVKFVISFLPIGIQRGQVLTQIGIILICDTTYSYTPRL